MKRKVFLKLKSNIILNKLYIYCGTLLINLIKIFIKPNDKLILFVSFGGKQYGDSPKAIYEAMLNDVRFESYEFVWAFTDLKAHTPPGNPKKVNINSIRYFIIALKARAWVSSMPIERRLRFKGKNTYYFGTWHGTPIKKLGSEVSEVYSYSNYDALCAQGFYDAKIWKNAFNIDESKILKIGLPRNDSLIKVSDVVRSKIKDKLNLPLDKKIIFYCPTFRDWQEDEPSIPVDFKKWQKKLDNDYIVLFRAHPKVAKYLNVQQESDFVYDVSLYSNINELMIVSDILISDYSSVFFDYSLLEKPMFCYTYDYDEYVKHRGVYIDIREKLLGGSITEDELLELILNTSYEEAVGITKGFKEEFVNYYGEASVKSVDYIYNKISIKQSS